MSNYVLGALAILIVLDGLAVAGVVIGGAKDARRRRDSQNGRRS